MSSYKKYNNTITTRFGQTFDSYAECMRYSRLKFLESEGVISGLERQVEFLLKSGSRKLKYICDFKYTYNSKSIVEDVKNPRLFLTNKFQHRVHLVMEQHGVEVLCVHPGDVMIFPPRKMV